MATRAVSRRSVAKLAYGAPVVAASMRLRSVGAQEAVSLGPTCLGGFEAESFFVLAEDTRRPVYPATIVSYLGCCVTSTIDTLPTGFAKGCVYNGDWGHVAGESDGRWCACLAGLPCPQTMLPDGTVAWLLTCIP